MPIRVDLLRHGISEASHPEGDAARELTPAGDAAIRALGEQLGRTAWRPELAVSSPYRRARATLARVLEAAGAGVVPTVMRELEPESSPAEAERALAAALGSARHVLLVAHQPMLGLLAKRWTGAPLPFSPGELLGIEFESAIAPGAGHIVERITPHR